MADTILKIIKAFVISLAIIVTILFALFINKFLLDLINNKNIAVNETKIINTSSGAKNIEGTLIKALETSPESQPISTSDYQESPLKNFEDNGNDLLINKYFSSGNDSSPNKLGANMHWAFREEPCRDVLINDAIYQANIKYVREEFNWNLIEPIKGKMDYSRYDEIMQSYQHYDVEVLGLLAYSAKWSAQAPNNVANKEFYPPNIDQWNNFVRETVTRYQGQVSAWEVWNEPNDINFFNGARKQYYNLLANTSNTIKSIDPAAKVISGGTTWPDPNYAQDFYKANMQNYIDGYGVHAYYCEQGVADGHYEKLAGDLAEIIQISNQYKKPLWITEFGCSSFTIGQKKQADNLAYMMTLFNASQNIERVYWYSLRDTGHVGKEGEYGLITKNYTLKQSFQAFKHFSP